MYYTTKIYRITIPHLAYQTRTEYHQMMYNKERKISFVRIALLIAIVLISGAAGYAIGTRNPTIITVQGLTNSNDGTVASKDFSVFWDTWRTIQNSYLRAADVKTQKLIYGSASGLVNALGDPYSVFLNPDDSKKFSEDINGNFGGIGAEIGIKNEQMIIVAPLKNSPAEKAGLLSGDKILEINASSTIAMNINEAVKIIRGPKGTTVTFTIGRASKEKPLKITVVRDIIKIPILEWKMKEGNIAHIQFFTFSENSPDLMLKALNELRAAGAKGIVLDMRNNPGGYLDSAVQIAGYFLEQNTPIVYEEFRNGKRDTFTARGNPIAKNIPLVVLINNGSASASEIVAGALKDDRGVKIIGEKSFGKGTVQELIRLREGSEVKLTIAHWILPKGAQIDKNGIAPDVTVKISDEDREKKRDPQLDKALEVIKLQLLKPL